MPQAFGKWWNTQRRQTCGGWLLQCIPGVGQYFGLIDKCYKKDWLEQIFKSSQLLNAWRISSISIIFFGVSEDDFFNLGFDAGWPPKEWVLIKPWPQGVDLGGWSKSLVTPVPHIGSRCWGRTTCRDANKADVTSGWIAGFRFVVQDELWHLLRMWGRNSLPGWFALQNHSRCVEEDDQTRLEWHAFPCHWKQSDMSSFFVANILTDCCGFSRKQVESHFVLRVILSIYFQHPTGPTGCMVPNGKAWFLWTMERMRN